MDLKAELAAYLVSKYSAVELASFRANCGARLALEKKGVLVYSPVLESHGYGGWQREDRCPKCHAANFALLGYEPQEDKKKRFVFKCMGCRHEFYQEDVFKHKQYSHAEWLRHDIRLLERLRRGDGRICCSRCNWALLDGKACMCPTARETYIRYDSGVALVVLESAYEVHECPTRGYNPGSGEVYTEFVYQIHSKGAELEISWALDKHVLIIRYEDALKYPVEAWKEHAMNEALAGVVDPVLWHQLFPPEVAA